jgi:hypothetical protein
MTNTIFFSLHLQCLTSDFDPSDLLLYIQISKQKKVCADFYLIPFLILEIVVKSQTIFYLIKWPSVNKIFAKKRVLLEVSTLSITDRLIAVHRPYR